MQTAAVAQRLSYDEFGRVMEDTNPGFQPFGFAGGLYDADTGFVHFGAREYDPYVGRWISKDPIGFNGGQSNIYVYVANDPVSYVDVHGLVFLPGCLAGAAAGALVGSLAAVAAQAGENAATQRCDPPSLESLLTGAGLGALAGCALGATAGLAAIGSGATTGSALLEAGAAGFGPSPLAPLGIGFAKGTISGLFF